MAPAIPTKRQSVQGTWRKASKADTTIFSIGVDVGGQTIQQYITQSENANGYSVVDRTGTSYEIGDPRSTESYKNWLSNSSARDTTMTAPTRKA